MCVLQEEVPANISLPASSPPLDPSEYLCQEQAPQLSVLCSIRWLRCVFWADVSSACKQSSLLPFLCRCVCSPGYVGDDCSIDYNDCEEHRCQNGAQCVDELSGYSCICPKGFRWEEVYSFLCSFFLFYFLTSSFLGVPTQRSAVRGPAVPSVSMRIGRLSEWRPLCGARGACPLPVSTRVWRATLRETS